MRDAMVEMTPAMVILTSPLIGNAASKLWRAADDVIEYRLRLADKLESDYGLLKATNLLQHAASLTQASDNGETLDALKAAVAVCDDPYLADDIRRLICDLGYPCQEHGAETFEQEIRPNNYTGANADDTINMAYCLYCGKAMRDFPLQWEDLEGEKGY